NIGCRYDRKHTARESNKNANLAARFLKYQQQRYRGESRTEDSTQFSRSAFCICAAHSLKPESGRMCAFNLRQAFARSRCLNFRRTGTYKILLSCRPVDAYRERVSIVRFAWRLPI